MSERQNDKMQRTSHGENEGSPLILGCSQVNDATFRS